MHWVQDRYIVLAGDVVLAHCGRAYNCKTKAWETISGTKMRPSIDTPYQLRAVFLRIYNAAGAGLRGRLGELYIVGDPGATERQIRLQGGNDLLGGSSFITWQGRYPLCAGFQWQITQGGLVAGDIVEVKVGYDER